MSSKGPRAHQGQAGRFIPTPGLAENVLLWGAACGCLSHSCKLLGESRIAQSQDSRPQDPSSSLTPGSEHAP